MLFKLKNRRQKELQVELGDLQNEKEHLSNFLQSKLKVLFLLYCDIQYRGDESEERKEYRSRTKRI